MVELIKKDFPGECFTSITLVKDAALPPHKDKYNWKGSWNLLSPLKVPRGGGIWEELKPGDVFTGTYKEMEVKGRMVQGQLHNLDKPQRVNPHRLHSPVQGEPGERVVIVGHTINSWKKLSGEDKKELEEIGFPIPEIEELVEGYDPQRGSEEPPMQCKVHVAEENFLKSYPVEDMVERMEDEIKIAKAASDSLYTDNIEELLATMDGDLGVVHTVRQAEVEPNLVEWKEALQAEMDALVNMGAIEKLRGAEAKALARQPGVTIVPGKGVYTVKPPQRPGKRFRRKVRIVSCGNHVEKAADEQNYSGGAAAESVRLGIAESSRRKWNIGTGDIKNAFLRAPVPPGVVLALRPPAILVRAGLATADELWLCRTAMYGYRSSPKWWSDYRNGKMREAVTEMKRTFHQGEVDPNVWQIREEDGTICGYIIVYVDDVMISGEVDTIRDAYKWIESTWEATPLEIASEKSAVRFLGMEVRKVAGEEGEFAGYTIDQSGFIKEILRHRGVERNQRALIPAPKEWMTLDPEQFPQAVDERQMREAQSRTGELLWLAQRSRPDLSYVTSIMGSLASRDPERANRIGQRVLMYVNATQNMALHYRSDGGMLLNTYTDASYAPEGDRSHAGIITFWSTSPISWRSSRQSLVTTSSAEAELLAASEGARMLESIDALLEDFGIVAEKKTLLVDNSAAITIATSEGGSWRTRHLKVRHKALRQEVEEGLLKIEYCPGEAQLADGLTKMLPSQRMLMLTRFWGLYGSQDEEGSTTLLKICKSAEEEANTTQPENSSSNLTPTHTTARRQDTLGCCLGLLVFLQGLVSGEGRKAVGAEDDEEPMAVDSSLEFYAMVLMVIICAVALWEGAKSLTRSTSQAARLRSLAPEPQEQGLHKQNLRRLNRLLKRGPENLSNDEKQDLIELADGAGVDISGVVLGATKRERLPSPNPPTPVRDPTLDNELERMWFGQEASSSSSRTQLPVMPPPPPPIESVRREGRSKKDKEVQVNLLKEMPKKVFLTPSGGCIHSTRDCSTLAKSVKYVEKDLCTKCIQGQSEVTERPV